MVARFVENSLEIIIYLWGQSPPPLKQTWLSWGSSSQFSIFAIKCEGRNILNSSQLSHVLKTIHGYHPSLENRAKMSILSANSSTPHLIGYMSDLPWSINHWPNPKKKDKDWLNLRKCGGGLFGVMLSFKFGLSTLGSKTKRNSKIKWSHWLSKLWTQGVWMWFRVQGMAIWSGANVASPSCQFFGSGHPRKYSSQLLIS